MKTNNTFEKRSLFLSYKNKLKRNQWRPTFAFCFDSFLRPSLSSHSCRGRKTTNRKIKKRMFYQRRKIRWIFARKHKRDSGDERHTNQRDKVFLVHHSEFHGCEVGLIFRWQNKAFLPDSHSRKKLQNHATACVHCMLLKWKKSMLLHIQTAFWSLHFASTWNNRLFHPAEYCNPLLFRCRFNFGNFGTSIFYLN